MRGPILRCALWWHLSMMRIMRWRRRLMLRIRRLGRRHPVVVNRSALRSGAVGISEGRDAVGRRVDPVGIAGWGSVGRWHGRWRGPAPVGIDNPSLARRRSLRRWLRRVRVLVLRWGR